MTEFLIFRLYGNLSAWGDIAVGEIRPTFTHPSKSAVLGIIAASLGIRREDDEIHRSLAESYGFAVRVDQMGLPLSDYHTTQVLSSGTGRNRTSFSTRKDEITSLPKFKLNTILSRRDYRMDAAYIPVIWDNANDSLYSLKDLLRSLERPVFAPYLGRKSCPLALPMQPQIISAPSIREALHKASFVREVLGIGETTSLYWEPGCDSGIEKQHVFTRRDYPLSRTRWQFDNRHEFHAYLDGDGS